MISGLTDYRLNDEIHDNYQKINIKFLIVAAITIGAGVCVFIYDSPDRELYFLDLLFATIVLVAGCIGMVGALHKYKELPEGEFCCRPGKNSIVSARFSICVWFIAGLLWYGYYNTEDLTMGQVLFGAFQTVLILFSMINFLCSRVYGIVGNGDKYIKFGIMGQKEQRYSDIAYISRKIKWLLYYNAYNHEKEKLFGVNAFWQDADKLLRNVSEKVID